MYAIRVCGMVLFCRTRLLSDTFVMRSVASANIVRVKTPAGHYQWVYDAEGRGE